MEDKRISLEIAKKAMELGCNVGPSVFCWEFEIDEKKIFHSKELGFSMPFNEVNVRLRFPTQSLLQKYLREKHHIEIHVRPSFNDEAGVLYDFKIGTSLYAGVYKVYENALEEALMQGLSQVRV